MIKPTGSNIHVKRMPAEGSVHRSSSLIIIPGTTSGIGSAWMQWDSFECEVLAIGPGELLANGTREPLDVEQGMIVVLPQGHGDDTGLEDGSFIVDISAVEAIVKRKAE